METRRLGNSDLNLSAIGLGTWAIGGSWQFGWGPQDDSDSIDAILEALDNGVNWIDTAAIYGHGHSEEVVGRALKQASARPIIATKCGLRWDDKSEKINCLKADSIKRECEESLARLDVDVIDLYQVHWNQPDKDIEEGWGAVAELIKEGKVRYGGVSNFSVEQMRRCFQIHPVTSLQPNYSMLVRDIEVEIMPFCSENNIGIVAYSPMARGLLTGKFDHERLRNLPADDSRHMSGMFKEPKFSAALELVEKFKPIAEKNGKTPAQLAVAWILRRPEVTSAICGARKKGQIAETAVAGDWRLTEDEIEQIDGFISEYDKDAG